MPAGKSLLRMKRQKKEEISPVQISFGRGRELEGARGQPAENIAVGVGGGAEKTVRLGGELFVRAE